MVDSLCVAADHRPVFVCSLFDVQCSTVNKTERTDERGQKNRK